MSPRGVPKRRTISIHCRACRTLLYKYAKGGTGSLVKCHVDRILQDFTAGDLTCPKCGQAFAREGAIGGKRVHRMIGGKTYTRGMTRK